jgi:hypothetical protein
MSFHTPLVSSDPKPHVPTCFHNPIVKYEVYRLLLPFSFSIHVSLLVLKWQYFIDIFSTNFRAWVYFHIRKVSQVLSFTQ